MNYFNNFGRYDMQTGFGAWVVTSRYEIMHQIGVDIEEMGNGKAWVNNRQLKSSLCRTGFYDSYVSDRTYGNTMMLGAICGDVAGSVYGHNNIKYIPDKDSLISKNAHFTDDTVMTLAVAVGIMNGLKRINKYKNFDWSDKSVLFDEIKQSLYSFGNNYPYAGYGGLFRQWLRSHDPQPYNSWGNGSAMRASYPGYIAKSLEDAVFLATVSSEVTHNHPEGIKGAVAIAGSITILLNNRGKLDINSSKQEVFKFVSSMYDLGFSLDNIRESYTFDVSCQGSVPYAVRAFLEGESFEEILALAISIGGDSDTIAAMAGSLAEVVYPIPEGMRDRVLKRLDYSLKSNLAAVIDFMIEARSKQ